MNGIFSVLQKIGRVFALPIAALPMAAFYLGLVGHLRVGHSLKLII